MDDTRQPRPDPAPRPTLPFLPAAFTLAVFALLAVWPPVIPGLPRAPRLVLLAALLASTLAWLTGRGTAGAGRVRSRRRARVARGRGPRVETPAVPADLLASPAWLHVVSGADADCLTRGLFEIAAALIERGERLLIVDGARRLRFHEALERRAGPGLLECLAGEARVPDAIQRGAHEMLGFLPRGSPMRSEEWPHLGRVLHEARTQFDRVVLALDFAVPQEAGAALAGLEAAGWWCPGESAPLLASAVAERIAIPLHSIRLTTTEDVLHEPGASSRIPRPRVLERPADPRPLPASEPALPPRIAPPIVDCDLQVRERLRFLMWMRSVQAESRRELGAPR